MQSPMPGPWLKLYLHTIKGRLETYMSMGEAYLSECNRTMHIMPYIFTTVVPPPAQILPRVENAFRVCPAHAF